MLNSIMENHLQMKDKRFTNIADCGCRSWYMRQLSKER